MSGESWMSLLDRDAMTLLFSIARLHPNLNVSRIARVMMEAKANIIKESPQHSDVAIHGGSGEYAETPTLMQPRLTKVSAGKLVHGSAENAEHRQQMPSPLTAL